MSTLNSFVVRAPVAADADDVARVHVQGWREAYSDLVPESFYDEAALLRRQAMWRSLLDKPLPIGRRVSVAEVNGQIVGFALAGDPPGDEPSRARQLFALYITGHHYGSGVGQALLDAVLGTEPAQLWVAEGNPRARAFYRRNGFEPDGGRKADADIDNLIEIRLVRGAIHSLSAGR
ncbi:MAG: putative acetyltransferase [Microbacteriaceae bacterium]|jgi:GNAT superfamily N-acetyltransferase|nr:putative acetyltransferase [Microbacteriaceae bacterium]